MQTNVHSSEVFRILSYLKVRYLSLEYAALILKDFFKPQVLTVISSHLNALPEMRGSCPTIFLKTQPPI